MKYIQATIAPDRLDAITRALHDVEVTRLTISEVEGAGREERKEELPGGEIVKLDFLPRLRLEIAVNEPFVDPTIKAIRAGAGEDAAAGMILVFPLEDCIRIRTGERGPEAV